MFVLSSVWVTGVCLDKMLKIEDKIKILNEIGTIFYTVLSKEYGIGL